MKQKEIQLTQEEIERGERLLQAERKKCELAIERAKSELEELKKSSGFFKLKSNKEEIKKAEENLRILEDKYVDLTSMNGADFALELKSKDGVKQSINLSSIVNSNVLHSVGNIVEKVGDVLPISGVSIGTKVIGKTLKNIVKK